MQLHVLPTPTDALRELAGYFVAAANRAVAAHGRFSVALSGGSSPRRLYELLASSEFRSRVDWQRAYFFFGDERNVPPTDPDSNYRMAATTLFAPLPIEAAQVFAVNTRLPPAEAAEQYTAAINQHFGDEPTRFDLVLLGLGDNSHTASLFPRTPVLREVTAGAKEVFVAEKQAYRITLTAPLINQARAVAFLVFGADKAAAVRHVLEDQLNIEDFPAQLICPIDGELHWFLDAAAASGLQRQH
ncbi:MAG: 6-phosphogluconolactonase [Hymenobacter sp.]|nr:6-phosphogluconolactonase [Hymenobacter sp.]